MLKINKKSAAEPAVQKVGNGAIISFLNGSVLMINKQGDVKILSTPKEPEPYVANQESNIHDIQLSGETDIISKL